MRQILLNESNQDLRYLYFKVLMLDGVTPALSETGGQPQINITNTGWDTIDIGVLQTVGYGNYRALLSNDAVSNLGIIISRYIGSNTLECFGESVEVVQNYRIIDIFEDTNSPQVNLYASVSEADAYFSTIFHSRKWECSTIDIKLKALMAATQDIENLAFSGWKTVSTQTLEFPRNGSLTIPNQIKQASCEIALKYLEGYNYQLEAETLRITHESFLSTRTTYNQTIPQEAKLAGINSEKAWRLLKPFLRDPRYLKVIRSS